LKPLIVVVVAAALCACSSLKPVALQGDESVAVAVALDVGDRVVLQMADGSEHRARVAAILDDEIEVSDCPTCGDLRIPLSEISAMSVKRTSVAKSAAAIALLALISIFLFAGPAFPPGA